MRVSCKAVLVFVFSLVCISAYADNKVSSEKLIQVTEKLSAIARESTDTELSALLQDVTSTAEILQAFAQANQLTKKEVQRGLGKINASLGRAVAAFSRGSKDIAGQTCIDLIKELQQHLQCCCHKTLGQLEEISDFLEKHLPCAAPTVIDRLPYEITRSGRYCLKSDLCYSGSSGSCAITVCASNVLIDFDTHTLTLSGNTRGICAQDVCNIIIQNGVIQSACLSINSNSAAVELEGVTDVACDSMSFRNTYYGIVAGSSTPSTLGTTNLQVINCAFNHPSPAEVRAISLIYSQGTVIDGCTFEQVGTFGNGISILISDSADNRITNCQFLNTDHLSDAIGIRLEPISRPCDNTIIENCSFDSCRTAFDADAAGQIVRSVIIRNCVGTNLQSPGFRLLGDGFLVENCVLQAAPTSSFALIFIGGNKTGGPVATFLASHDVTLKNCTLINKNSSPSFNCIWAAYVDGLLIDSCLVDSNGSGQFYPENGSTPPVANIHLGSIVYQVGDEVVLPGFGGTVSNVRIVNCIIHGNSQFAILAETGDVGTPNKSIVIEDTSIDGAAQAGIFFLNTETSVIRNCHIKNITGNHHSCGHGILIGESLPIPYNQTGLSRHNEISYCTIANCGGTGILIKDRAQYTFITHNETFSNRKHGIENQGNHTNRFYDNSSCNNFDHDCAGNIPSELIGSPGTREFRLRQNSCCNFCRSSTSGSSWQSWSSSSSSSSSSSDFSW